MSNDLERLNTVVTGETGTFGHTPDFFATCAVVRIARANLAPSHVIEESRPTSTGSHELATRSDRGSEQCTMDGRLNSELLQCDTLMQLKDPIGLLPPEFRGLGVDDLGRCALLRLLASSVVRDDELGQNV
jgi:hypothetical protein